MITESELSQGFVEINRNRFNTQVEDSNSTNHLVAYNDAFFEEERENSLKSAEVLVPIIISWLNPKSVVDFGCGAGAFLKVFLEKGKTDVLGIDGTIPKEELLLVKKDKIKQCDLTEPLALPSKFDVVLSLEVAEHLSPEFALTFVSNLARAGDIIVFSAAVPHQGGTHHVNEQWPEYWANLFEREGFLPIDCIRPVLWNKDEIDPIYAQNTILYVRKTILDRFSFLTDLELSGLKYPMPLVHPKVYAAKSKQNQEIKSAIARKTAKLLNKVLSKLQ